MKRFYAMLLCAMTMLMAKAQVNPYELTIVGETTFTIQQEPRDSWASIMYEVPVTGIAELLGVERSYLQENFVPMFYAQTWDYENAMWGNLTNEGNVDVPAGFYYHCENVFNLEGDEVPVTMYSTDWNNPFFFHRGEYDPDNDVVIIGCGQNPGREDRVGRHNVDNYIVNEDKAYIIHFNVNIEVPEQEFTIESMTSVGGTEWNVQNRDPRKGWDVLESMELDMEDILARFTNATGQEVTIGDIKFMAINSYGQISDSYSADNDDVYHGFWFNGETGQSQGFAWGVKSFFINYAYNDGVLFLGNMPEAFAGGEVMHTTLYLTIADTYYYSIDVNINIAACTFTLEDCELTEKNIVVQLVPSAEAWEVRRLDVSYLEEMMGASDLKFYGVTAEGEITTTYSVSEAASGGGGFWMSAVDENGWAHAAGYTGDGAFAIWYTGQGEMVFFNVPGLYPPGAKAKATFYMANLWEGKALKLNMTVRYVEEIKEIDVLGSDDITLAPRNESGDNYSVTELDLEACAAVFGIAAEEIRDVAVLAVINTNGDLTADEVNDMNMFTFNADGELVDEESEEARFSIGMIDGSLYAYVIRDEDVDKVYKATLYLVCDTYVDVMDENGDWDTVNKIFIYAYNVTVKSGSSDAIDVVAATHIGKIYDLSGREVSKPSKGMFIKTGKKYIIK